MSFNDWLGQSEGDAATWFRRRARDVARFTDEADEWARNAWNDSTRTGENLVARTPAELKALASRFSPAARAPTPASTGAARGAAPRTNIGRLSAGARGAMDAVAMGHGDEVGAGLEAIPAFFTDEGFGPRYQELLRRAQDQDRYDETNYPVSRGVGEVLGTGAAFLATDGLAAAAAPRFAAGAYSAARAVPALSLRARGMLAASGAGAGVAGQLVSDILTRQAPNWRDYASSAVGGATIASAAPKVGAIYAGGLGGATRYLADASLNGAPVRTDSLAGQVTEGAYFGGAGRTIGEGGSNSLNWKAKGKLGEGLSGARLWLDGEDIVGRQKVVKLGGGRSTRVDYDLEPDPVTNDPRFVESKFGPTARLSSSQRLAAQLFPDSYSYHYWMPRHVGDLFGSTLSAAGVPMLDPK